MAASPRWKVYDRTGIYQASCKEIEAAGSLMAFYGAGALIRDNLSGVVVWREDQDGSAGLSYDTVAELAHQRVADSFTHKRLAREQKGAKPHATN